MMWRGRGRVGAMSEVRASLGWCVVLAAGRGRRMGVSKALMRVDGEVWWRRQLRGLHAVGVRSVWVVSEETWGEMAREGAEEMLQSGGGGGGGEGGVVLARGECAMMVSVVAGLRGVVERAGEGEVRGEGVFVLPVDVPVCGVEVWGRLRMVMRGEGGDGGEGGREELVKGKVAAVPRVRVGGGGVGGEGGEVKRGHPVLLFGRFVMEEILARARGDEGWAEGARLDELMSRPVERRVMVDVADALCGMNLNTEGDVRGMEKR